MLDDSLNVLDGAPGVDMPPMDHVHKLRDEISKLQETTSVRRKDLLQLQDDFLTVHSERCPVQSGADVPSMDHLQKPRDGLTSVIYIVCAVSL